MGWLKVMRYMLRVSSIPSAATAGVDSVLVSRSPGAAWLAGPAMALLPRQHMMNARVKSLQFILFMFYCYYYYVCCF